MSFKNSLSKIWKAVTNPEGPYHPSQEIVEILEKRGYKFNFKVITGPSLMFSFSHALHCSISKNGRPIGGLLGDPHLTKIYLEEYKWAENQLKNDFTA